LTPRAPEALTHRFQHPLEALEPVPNFLIRYPGIRIQAFGEGAQLVSHGRIGDLTGNSREYLGVSGANTHQAFRTKRPVDRRTLDVNAVPVSIRITIVEGRGRKLPGALAQFALLLPFDPRLGSEARGSPGDTVAISAGGLSRASRCRLGRVRRARPASGSTSAGCASRIFGQSKAIPGFASSMARMAAGSRAGRPTRTAGGERNQYRTRLRSRPGRPVVCTTNVCS